MKRLSDVRGVVAVVLLAAAFLSWWLLRSTGTAHNVDVADHDAPDYYVRGYELTVWDERGELRHRLVGPQVMHYPQRSRAELASPELVLYRDSSPRWRLRAQSALVTDDAQELWLQGDVVIDEPLDAAGLILNTRDVHVLPQKRYAETQAPVAVRDAAGEMHGTGMRVDMGGDRVELLSAVRGEYVLP